MKILHLVDSFDPTYERDQIKVVKMCAEKGYDTVVLTTSLDSDGKNVDPQYFYQSDILFGSVKIIRPYSRKVKLPYLDPVSAYVPSKILLNHFDLMHIYTVGSYSSLIGSFSHKINLTPIVLRAEMSHPLYHRLKTNALLRAIAKRILDRSNKMYSFTYKERQLLIDLGIPEGKIEVIPPSIDTDRFKKICKSRSEIGIGYIGRYTYAKGVHKVVKSLVKIAREFPEVKIFFAGPQTDKDYANDVISAFKDIKNFTYLGTPDLEEFFSLTDIVLIPSLMNETGSITTLEAMAAGKVVIASSITPMNEYIRNGFSGLLVNEEDQYYFYCKELLTHTERLAEMGEQAQERAKFFDNRIMFNKMESLYLSVIEE